MFGMQMGKLGGVGQMTLAQRIAYMFANSEPGAWYDPSDLSTLFQDIAGTVPVTAVEQFVALMLDKSGRGNHATQATATKRPVYSRRVNLLVKTIAGAVWNTATKTEIPNYFGSDVGFSLYQDAVAFGDSPSLTSSQAHPAGQKLTSSVLVDMSTVNPGSSSRVWIFGLVAGGGVAYAQGVLASSGNITGVAGTGVTEVSASRELLYGSVYRISISARFTAALTATRIYCEAVNFKSSVWGRPQITLATDAHLPYQRVNTATDYDADPAKFPAYLLFDGVDDAMQTGNIDFTGTDKMTVLAGITALDMVRASGAPGQLLYSNGDNYNGFGLRAPSSSGSISFVSSGNVGIVEPASSFHGIAPANLIMCGYGDQGAPLAVLRSNGVQRTVVNTAQGTTGGYGNRPMWLASHGGTIRFFNGRLYGLIVRGAQSSQSQIEATELYVKQKMRLP